LSITIDFTGRTVLVTGAGGLPGKGMGRSLALGFAELGAQVAAVDVDPETLGETVSRIEAIGGKAVAITADLCEEDQIERAADEAEQAFGPVDVLCNHAAFGDFQSITETEPARWRKMMALDLTAPFLLSRRVLPSMMERRTGVIVNTVSICGLTGGRSGAAYTAAKHGLVGLTKNVAVSHASYGIRCVGVAPGGTRQNPDGQAESAVIPEEGSWGASFIPNTQAINLRTGRPDEVTRMHLFLASDAASFLNGVVIPVDGGWTAV
jgi:NAD(P)-dependent dehydrogenase (short-subunit alcohol dehydrogenase family)